MYNSVILITYPDSLGSNLNEMHEILNEHLSKAVGGIHLLPFYPSSGDRGFAPIDYSRVDARFGSWQDVESLAEEYHVIVDYMINHISAQSKYFKDFLKNGDASAYKDLFIDFDTVWGKKPTAEQVDKIYKRKPRAPYVTVTLSSEETRNVWCTFGEEQIDLNTESKVGKKFLKDNLERLMNHGIKGIRLDAFAYAVKKADSSCFFVEPEIWDLLHESQEVLDPYNATLLPEVHEHYSVQKKIAEKGYPVYDFALPMLLLHAIYFNDISYLSHWFAICPRNQFTTLDTHDGIGVVDVKDLLPDEEIEKTKEYLFQYGANVKRVYNTAAYNNLDVYQINCTYYSALGDDDEAYLLARAVQIFAPGVPQIYYVGLLAGKNDLKLLEMTKEGRNINRHYYRKEEVEKELERPVVKKLLALMELRNTHPAFQGTFSQGIKAPCLLQMCWEYKTSKITLLANFATKEFTIEQ